MADNERPLPKPPKTPFGRQRSVPDPGEQDLLADRMAAAAAAGRLDEFLKENMPESEHAQALAKMMMGMTGMMPGAMPTPSIPQEPHETNAGIAGGPVPEDLLRAVQGGDVKGLMDMLRREHEKRSPGAADAARVESGPPTAPEAASAAAMPTIDKELIDSLIRIAKDNSVSLDWLILRAIKVYVEEHQRSGKL